MALEVQEITIGMQVSSALGTPIQRVPSGEPESGGHSTKLAEEREVLIQEIVRRVLRALNESGAR